MQGAANGVVGALSRADLEAAELPEDERALMEFVRLMTERPATNTPENIERLRQVGWTDAQIAEAVYVIGLFAMFNRVADAFGIVAPNYADLRQGHQGKSDNDEQPPD